MSVSPGRLTALLLCLVPPPSANAQDLAAQATAALEQGRPWQATQILRPAVADLTRTPAATTLLAAQAAAAWGGWSSVVRLLGSRTWPDRESEGTARELLGRAALDRRADREAADHLRRSISLASEPRIRGIRTALLARSLERLERPDSAAAAYLAAAALLPEAAEWLGLRAAALLPDSGARARIYRTVGAEPARSRVARVEAAALERVGALEAAAARYAALGARGDALRLRLAAASSDSVRTSLRRDLVALLTAPLGAEESRNAIALLDQLPGTLSLEEHLAVARRAAAIGNAARAVRGFTAARGQPGFTDGDRLRFGLSLVQAGRPVDAMTEFSAIRDPAHTGAAAYHRARLTLDQSGATAAIAALLRVPEVAGRDTASAGIALFLAGDLVADQGDYVAARRHYRRVATEYPTAAHAARALLEVGTLSLLLGERDAALAAFEALAERYPEGDEGPAGLYWAGRIEAERGSTASARARWRTVIAGTPHSYYALAAARRLGEAPWTPDSTAAIPPPPAETVAGLARAALLDSIGFSPERDLELDQVAVRAGNQPAELVATATALAATGHTARSVTLAQRALRFDAPRTRELYRLLFPVPEPTVFPEMAAARDLDPWLTAGLIKQESGFNPRARSAADARGLMQVLPTVGAQLARRLGWADWDGVLLYQPEVSLTLGTLHLQEMRRQYPDPVRFLAAYNAGGTRVRRWDARPGVQDDPELFLERIPYIETRNYVRRVLRNAAFYEGLYGSER